MHPLHPFRRSALLTQLYFLTLIALSLYIVAASTALNRVMNCVALRTTKVIISEEIRAGFYEQALSLSAEAMVALGTTCYFTIHHTVRNVIRMIHKNLLMEVTKGFALSWAMRLQKAVPL
jgi:hypothetical protein